MIFPRSEGEWKNRDEHYWARKRLVIGGVMLGEGATMARQLTQAVPPLDDYWFWFCGLPNFPITALLFPRTRRADLGRSSRCGHEVGISLIGQSSTSTSELPK